MAVLAVIPAWTGMVRAETARGRGRGRGWNSPGQGWDRPVV
jgi:hypothetical protein